MCCSSGREPSLGVDSDLPELLTGDGCRDLERERDGLLLRVLDLDLEGDDSFLPLTGDEALEEAADSRPLPCFEEALTGDGFREVLEDSFGSLGSLVSRVPETTELHEGCVGGAGDCARLLVLLPRALDEALDDGDPARECLELRERLERVLSSELADELDEEMDDEMELSLSLSEL